MDADRPVYTIVEKILRPLFTVVYRIRITGREHVPDTGPCVLAANHVSVMDGFFLGIAVTRQVRFMAKSELYRVPVVKQILHAAGAFPVERGADAGRAVAAGMALLERGACIGLFPEGTSLPDQKRGYKRGAARLALASGAPLIPVALDRYRAHARAANAPHLVAPRADRHRRGDPRRAAGADGAGRD